jgi:hypothetical protein
MTFILYNNSEYVIQSNKLKPVCEYQLPEQWISAYSDSEDHTIWVISYYLDILRSQDKDTAWIYEESSIDYMVQRRSVDYGRDLQWGYNFGHMEESLVINPATIIMGGFRLSNFLITSIAPYETGYKITVKGDELFSGYGPNEYAIRLPFPRYTDRETFDLIFIPDGDFMDVYLDTLDNHLASFAKVNKSYIEELNRLINDDICDVFRLTNWPRRSDGGMDYPPPILPSSAVILFRPTHSAKANLNIRNGTSATAGLIKTIPRGTKVRALNRAFNKSLMG